MKSIKYKDLVKMVEEKGATFLRKGKGSHMIYQLGDKIASIPKHGGKSIPPGTCRDILKRFDIKIAS